MYCMYRTIPLWYCCGRYRAKYIVGSVALLQARPEGGEAWLLALRARPLEEVVQELTTLPGGCMCGGGRWGYMEELTTLPGGCLVCVGGRWRGAHHAATWLASR